VSTSDGLQTRVARQAQRTEILCALHPVPPPVAAAWSAAPGRRGLPHPSGRGPAPESPQGTAAEGSGARNAAKMVASQVPPYWVAVRMLDPPPRLRSHRSACARRFPHTCMHRPPLCQTL
jgi:hypothetical protein